MEANPYIFANFQFIDHLPHTFNDLFLTSCGVQSCSPGHFFGPGSHNDYVLHFVCSGKGTYVVNQTAYTLTKGDFFLIHPHTKIHYYADDRDPWSYIWIGFQGENAATCIEQAALDMQHLTGRYDDTALILSYIQEMLLAKENTFTNELKRQVALLHIFTALIDKRQQSMAQISDELRTRPSYVQMACDYILDHYAENIKISQIAKHIGIDRSYMTNLFKEILGISPSEYLINCRLERAAQYLKTTDMRISSIAAKVGYQDALTFSKRFKHHYHMTPSEYRKI